MQRHYNVTTSLKMNDRLLSLSQEHNIPVLDLIRRFIRFGILENLVGPFQYTDKQGRQRTIEVFPPHDEENLKLRLWQTTDFQPFLEKKTS